MLEKLVFYIYFLLIYIFICISFYWHFEIYKSEIFIIKENYYHNLNKKLISRKKFINLEKFKRIYFLKVIVLHA